MRTVNGLSLPCGGPCGVLIAASMAVALFIGQKMQPDAADADHRALLSPVDVVAVHSDRVRRRLPWWEGSAANAVTAGFKGMASKASWAGSAMTAGLKKGLRGVSGGGGYFIETKDNGAACATDSDGKEKVVGSCGPYGNGMKCNDNFKCVDEVCTVRDNLCRANRNSRRSDENPNEYGNPFFLVCSNPNTTDYCDIPGADCTCQGGALQKQNGRCESCRDCAPGLKCIVNSHQNYGFGEQKGGFCMADGSQQIGDECGWNAHCVRGSNCARSNYQCELKQYVDDVCDSNGASTLGQHCDAKDGCQMEPPKKCKGDGKVGREYRNNVICWGDACDSEQLTLNATANQCGAHRVCRKGVDKQKDEFRCLLNNKWAKRKGQGCMDSSECQDTIETDNGTVTEMHLICTDVDGQGTEKCASY